MQRLLIPFAVGFLAALSGAISLSVLGVGRDAAIQYTADSLVAARAIHDDSLLNEADRRTLEPGASASLTVDTEVGGAPESSAAGPRKEAQPPIVEHRGEDREPPPTLILTSGASASGSERRLARTFAAMSPRDAARVLELMSDSDVRTLMGYLNERQSAGILSNLSPSRAARLGELVLRSEEGS